MQQAFFYSLSTVYRVKLKTIKFLKNKDTVQYQLFRFCLEYVLLLFSFRIS